MLTNGCRVLWVYVYSRYRSFDGVYVSAVMCAIDVVTR